MIEFHKYHALGNDYLVLDPKVRPEVPAEAFTRLVCHRNFGLGSDGILYGPGTSDKAPFSLRIFNPDGSEAEKSGNGLRIFVRYLQDQGLAKPGEAFDVETPGGVVACLIQPDGLISIDMGRARFGSDVIPVTGPEREVINETMPLEGQDYTYCAATVGNPHAVFPLEEISEALARRLGPLVENDRSRFPNRTNVQFLKVLDRKNIQIEIWERGAGYTLASGTSSSAAGAVARKLGLVDEAITVHMPGGKIQLKFGDDFAINMTGPATRVGRYEMDEEALTIEMP